MPVLLFIHLTCVAIWIGGQITLFFATPIIRGSAADPGALMGAIGRRFGMVAGAALLLILLTGLAMANHIGADLWNFQDETSRLVSEKLTLFGLIVIVSGVHGYLGSRIARGEVGLRRYSTALSVVNLLLGLAAIWAAANLP